MNNLIFNDGFYFSEIDKKEEGYYIEDSDGKLIKQEYKPLSLWQKWKYKINTGFDYESGRKSISFFYFKNQFDDLVCTGNRIGDVISVAKSIKNKRYSDEGRPYEIQGNKIIIDKKRVILELEVLNNGQNLLCTSFLKDSNQILGRKHYTLLNLNHI